MTNPSKPVKRKFILIEVSTNLNNKKLAEAVEFNLKELLRDIHQIHVNTAKK